ncbi:ATP synthase subunit s protein-like, partial [Tropilaelaps mercedesae]
FCQNRLSFLGGELAAATFVVHRGAAVRFHGKDRWISRDPETEEYDLPRVFTPNLDVEAIDMRDFHIIPKGFENLRGCGSLRSLAMKNQPFVDDWCLDTISALFHPTLEYIDVTGCPKVTERGLSVLHRCKNLRVIYMNNMSNVKDAELLAMHLEDALPCVQIDGVDYWKYRQPESG